MARIGAWIGIVAVVTAGCGGSGGDFTRGPGGPPTPETRKKIGSLLQLNATGMAQSGVQSAAQADNAGRPGLPGIGWIGAFVRNQTTAGANLAVSGGDDGSGGAGGGGFYFDDWLGLWVQTEWSDSGVKSDLFEDADRARPAGFFRSEYPLPDSEYPIRWESRYEVTAGAFAGSEGEYLGETASAESGSMRYDGTWDGARSYGISSWDSEGSRWENRSNLKDGTWSKDEGSFRSDGSGQTLSETSLGYRIRFTWLSTGGGTGEISGPDPGLPAQIRWGADGQGTITYADGTVEPFSWWVTVTDDPVGGGGSSGGSSGSGSPPRPKVRR